jgi:hypothetical protein
VDELDILVVVFEVCTEVRFDVAISFPITLISGSLSLTRERDYADRVLEKRCFIG